MKLQNKGEEELNDILSGYYQRGYKDGFKSGCEGVINMAKQFKTKEEAEKAVEKLKAIKRLKDKGFSFNGWNWKTQCIDYNLDYTDITEKQIEEAEKDLDLLFGGEE